MAVEEMNEYTMEYLELKNRQLVLKYTLYPVSIVSLILIIAIYIISPNNQYLWMFFKIQLFVGVILGLIKSLPNYFRDRKRYSYYKYIIKNEGVEIINNSANNSYIFKFKDIKSHILITFGITFHSAVLIETIKNEHIVVTNTFSNYKRFIDTIKGLSGVQRRHIFKPVGYYYENII